MTPDDDHRTGPVGPQADQPQTEHSGADQKDHKITNVELQFMGRHSAREEIDAEVKASSHESGEYREHGMDKQDVAVEETMDASDPPSTNMGDANRK
ncbi:M-like protein [Deinococcus aerophilus]|uniref:M-like protein n=1 Tax=Deinococcus aerophilus TaxID=522488 RepID=A0ABQ2GWI1_9DEIO|nr:M-like protein [Deinococcus aerophilus]GGM15471.1 hypothetical protein GCM10010841_24910 [Deinococcus aerophilus]